MTDRLSGDELPFTFDHDLAADRDDVVFCHLGHRLVTQSLRLLRAEVWASGGNGGLAVSPPASVPPLAEVLEAGDVGVAVPRAPRRSPAPTATASTRSSIVAGGRLRRGRFAPHRHVCAISTRCSDRPATGRRRRRPR